MRKRDKLTLIIYLDSGGKHWVLVGPMGIVCRDTETKTETKTKTETNK